MDEEKKLNDESVNSSTEQAEQSEQAAQPEQTESAEPKKKKGFRAWWQAHKPTKRRLIQIYTALLYNANIKGFISGNIYIGQGKNFCVPGLNCYSCPGASGACPLGALQNAFAASNTRAPYYVLGIILLFGLILGRTICGFLCPVGLGQELLYKIKTPKLKKSRVTYIFSFLKYVLLAVFVVAIPTIYSMQQTALPAFCKFICPAGTFGGAVALLINPTNAGYFGKLGGLFTWKFVLMVAVIVASIFIFRFFCRFLCPLGALYGLFNKFSLLGIKLEKDKCTHCGLCKAHCKMDIRCVGDHECINCGECIKVCPSKAIRWKGSKLVERIDGAAAQPAGVAATVNSPLKSETAAVSSEAVSMNSATPCTAQAARPAKKRKSFWIQVGAWATALVFLGGVMVYYNFIDQGGSAAPPPVVETDCYLTVSSLSGTGGLMSFTVGKDGKGTNDWAIPSSGDGTEESPYVLENFPGIYDVSVAAGNSVYYTFRAVATDAYTISSQSADLSLTLFLYGEEGEAITVAQVIGAEEVSFTFSDVITPSGNQVGNLCYDFTVELYSQGGSFTLSEHRGKIVIINFWGTWCTPCVTEIPAFERIQEAYGDAVEVIAIHSAMITEPGATRQERMQGVQRYLDTKKDIYSDRVWSDYEMLFAQDNGQGLEASQVYGWLAADKNNSYPATLIVDEEGIVRFRTVSPMDYETLMQEIDAILGEASGSV